MELLRAVRYGTQRCAVRAGSVPFLRTTDPKSTFFVQRSQSVPFVPLTESVLLVPGSRAKKHSRAF